MKDHVYKGFKITNNLYSPLDDHGRRWKIYWNGTTNMLNTADTLAEARERIDGYIEHNGNKFGLTDDQYERFAALHTRHLNAWESDERREQHALENIDRVEYHPETDLFHVYYKATKRFKRPEWYHYDTNRGVWW
jgi:hypothetical protein